MRILTNEQLNDPTFFNDPKYDAEKRASYQRALAFYNMRYSIADRNFNGAIKRK